MQELRGTATIIQAIVSTMIHCRESEEVCESTCFALTRIARRIPYGAKEALDAGTLHAVISILQHWRTESVRKNAMEALLALTRAQEGKEVLKAACADPQIKNLVITNLVHML